MADNANITLGDGTAKVASDEVAYSGDTAKVQLVREVAVTGSEGSKTTIDKAYGAGAVNTGTQRITHASDDPLVAAAQSTAPVAVELDTSAISNNGTALTPKFAKIAVSSSGANTLVAAVTSKKIRVLAYNLIGNGAVNAKFQSHVTPTDLTGLKYIPSAGNGICANFCPVGWFETVSGEALDLNLSGAVAVGGELVYVEV